MHNSTFPILYHKGKVGVIYQWRIWTEGNEIYTEYGQVDGQLQITPGKKCFGKNVGRSNETADEEQADLEARSMWQFKRDRKYSETVEECKARKITPMLAPGKPFAETKKYVTYPCDVQPKLDGNRCLAYWEGDRIVLLSRGQKEWVLPHLVKQLGCILPQDAMFDGELYTHGYSCQQMTKLIKGKPMDQEKVQYHIYDVPVCDGEEKPWIERRVDLERLIAANAQTPDIFPLETFTANTEEEIMMFQSAFLQAGFEGGMVRLHNGMYEWGYRSKALLKVKTFDDHEYEIVGFTNGKGKNETTVKWICKLTDGRSFDCAATGNKADREQMFQDGDQYIGKLLKVKHFGFTDEGKPRFPVGIGFRVDEDLGV